MFETTRYFSRRFWINPTFRRRPVSTLDRLIVSAIQGRLGHILTRQISAMVAVDVGAYRGTWTVMMADAVGRKGKVVAFEPASVSAGRLRQTINIDDLDNVTFIEAAVSDTTGEARLYLHDVHDSIHSLGESDGSVQTVSPVSLDSALGDRNIHQLNAIKIDVEGHDERVIRGGLGTFKSCRPVLIFEANPERSQELGLDPDSGWRIVTQLGYRTFALDNNGRLQEQSDFWESQTPEYYWNLIAIHPQPTTKRLEK